jgi:hypothetical protein
MNPRVNSTEAPWTGKSEQANRCGDTKPPHADRLTGLLSYGGQSLRRVGFVLWILAVLCFLFATFVWWELLHA